MHSNQKGFIVMLRLHGPCTALCLCFLLVGIVIGGCLIALLPHSNLIHLTVLPNHAVNLSPEDGDLIDWVAYGRKPAPAQTAPNRPTITFTTASGSPCDKTAPAGTCLFNDPRPGIFTYHCSGSADCDPGIGPKTTTGTHFNQGIFGYILTGLARILGTLVFGIDRTFGFLPTPTERGSSEKISAARVDAALQTGGDPYTDASVGCGSNDTATVVSSNISDPSNISKPQGQNINWVGSDDFTLTIDTKICEGTTSTPGLFQNCKLVGTPETVYRYTVTDSSCKNPTSTTYTITPLKP
jgi:hypothetical protein